MASTDIFMLNHLVILSWLSLLIKPRHRFTHCFVNATVFLFILRCLVTFGQLLLQKMSNTSDWNFLTLQNLFALYESAFFAVATLDHVRITELWLGLWMVKHFHSRFTCGYNVMPGADGSDPHDSSWTQERVLFSAILVITYLLSPLGLIVYFLVIQSYFHGFVAREPIDWRNPQNLKVKKVVSAIDYQFLPTKIIGFHDSFPDSLRKLYLVARKLVGITVGLIVLGFYAVYVMYCLIFHRMKTNTAEKSPRWPPASVRAHTVKCLWQSTITPQAERTWLWKLNSYWLQVCTFILFGPSGNDPLALFRAMQHDFSASLGRTSTAGFFPFGDGVGVSSYKYVKAYLESKDPPIIKDFQTIGWSVSSSLVEFCNFTTIFLPNPSHPMPDRLLISRKVVHQWLAAFPHTLVSLNDSLSKKSTLTYRSLAHLVPRQPNVEPNQDVVYRAVGETLFFLATGGLLTLGERDAYLDCVKNPFTFLPDWFNFLVAGYHKLEQGYASYEKFQIAFGRHVQGPALQAAFEAAAGHMTKTEVLQLITTVFCLGAAPAPAKLTATIIKRLWSDQSEKAQPEQGGIQQAKMVDLFHENPRNFIKESARLCPILPMVSLLSNERIARDVKTHTGADLPTNTRIHCSLVDANQDPNEFTSPSEFNPKRSATELGKIITWNGSESEIEGKSAESRPPRYCPGHDLSLRVMEHVISRFAPIVSSLSQEPKDPVPMKGFEPVLSEASKHLDDDESEVVIFLRELNSRKSLDAKTDKHYVSSLDGYTRLIMKLTGLALKGWNAKPPRAIDISEPSNLPTQQLHLKRVDAARFSATWDEDNPSSWRFHFQLVNKILNSKLWPLEDHHLQFNSTDDMIAWRCKHFPWMPAPNNPQWYGDSDELMSRFAFFGLACHHTRKLDSNEEEMELHTATLARSLVKSAYYVNDMTALSLFAVRAPFDRYGAAAYFDRERRLIGIYLSHREELVLPLSNARGLDNEWTYAKYMWRSSALAMVTIRDHLLTTHFIESNTLTNISRQFLPAGHPLRGFLKPFTYRTVTVNYSAATSLVNQGGLCHRIWGFEYDEFLKLCDYVIAHYRFRIMPDWIADNMKLEHNRSPQAECNKQRHQTTHAKEDTNSYAVSGSCPKCGFTPTDSSELHNGIDEASESNEVSDIDRSEWVKHYPIAEDLPEFWKIMRDYVRRFFELEYGREGSTEELRKDKRFTERTFMGEPCERQFISELCKPLGLNGIPSRAHLIDVVTQLMCACTGIHEHVGHVGDYLFDPSFIGTKLRRDLPSMLPSVQNYSLMLVLTVLTGMKMPGLMEDWSHLIPRVATDGPQGQSPSIMTEDQVRSHLDNYYLFKQQLAERAAKIDERHRLPDTFPFESFNPSFMECSVSV